MSESGFTDSAVGRTWTVGKFIDELMKYGLDQPFNLCGDGFNQFPMTPSKIQDIGECILIGYHPG